MPKKTLESIEKYFSQVTDPRVDRTKEHKLIDMIAIAICGPVSRIACACSWRCALRRSSRRRVIVPSLVKTWL